LREPIDEHIGGSAFRTIQLITDAVGAMGEKRHEDLARRFDNDESGAMRSVKPLR
jgi:hypothetical protein